MAANGTRERRPVRRPLVSRTTRPPGARRGDPQPARMRGSTIRFSMRKNSVSIERGAFSRALASADGVDVISNFRLLAIGLADEQALQPIQPSIPWMRGLESRSGTQGNLVRN